MRASDDVVVVPRFRTGRATRCADYADDAIGLLANLGTGSTLAVTRPGASSSAMSPATFATTAMPSATTRAARARAPAALVRFRPGFGRRMGSSSSSRSPLRSLPRGDARFPATATRAGDTPGEGADADANGAGDSESAAPAPPPPDEEASGSVEAAKQPKPGEPAPRYRGVDVAGGKYGYGSQIDDALDATTDPNAFLFGFVFLCGLAVFAFLFGPRPPSDYYG
jgi:hypothetical protein